MDDYDCHVIFHFGTIFSIVGAVTWNCTLCQHVCWDTVPLHADDTLIHTSHTNIHTHTNTQAVLFPFSSATGWKLQWMQWSGVDGECWQIQTTLVAADQVLQMNWFSFPCVPSPGSITLLDWGIELFQSDIGQGACLLCSIMTYPTQPDRRTGIIASALPSVVRRMESPEQHSETLQQMKVQNKQAHKILWMDKG